MRLARSRLDGMIRLKYILKQQDRSARAKFRRHRKSKNIRLLGVRNKPFVSIASEQLSEY
jgi:hypothetical protein